jgi:hypothetical protein
LLVTRLFDSHGRPKRYSELRARIGRFLFET